MVRLIELKGQTMAELRQTSWNLPGPRLKTPLSLVLFLLGSSKEGPAITQSVHMVLFALCIVRLDQEECHCIEGQGELQAQQNFIGMCGTQV